MTCNNAVHCSLDLDPGAGAPATALLPAHSFKAPWLRGIPARRVPACAGGAGRVLLARPRGRVCGARAVRRPPAAVCNSSPVTREQVTHDITRATLRAPTLPRERPRTSPSLSLSLSCLRSTQRSTWRTLWRMGAMVGPWVRQQRHFSLPGVGGDTTDFWDRRPGASPPVGGRTLRTSSESSQQVARGTRRAELHPS